METTGYNVKSHQESWLYDSCVEAKLHGESKMIQRCFDDNNDDNKRWWQRWWQKAQRTTQVNKRWIKNSSRVQDKNQEEFKTQEESLESRIKIQDSRSRFKIQDQDSRIKRRLNQDKYEKVFSKIE